MGRLTMTVEQREAFLAEVRVGVLAVARADGPPLTTPIWYRYAPGGTVEMVTESGSRKAAAARLAGRATFCVQRDQVPYAYVTVEGTVAVGESTAEQRRGIAARYLPESAVDAFLASVDDDAVLVLTPERWLTSDFAVLDGAS